MSSEGETAETSGLDPARTARARSFGQVAENYDRYRPGYPDALYKDVLALTPSHRVLEGGAGTGRATLGLAQHGASVIAVEHDPDMAEIVRRRTEGLDVEVVVSRFEDYSPVPGSFDIVAAAQAWHWLEPMGGADISAQALKQGGALCIWWNRPSQFKGAVWDAVHDVYQRLSPDLDRRSAIETRRYSEPMPNQYSDFSNWELRTYEWEQIYSASEYVGFLATHSDHIVLPEIKRTHLLNSVERAIDDHAGTLTYEYRTLLYVARRL